MTPSTITNTEICQDTTTVVCTDAATNTTTTETLTDNQTTTITETSPTDDCQNQCPCGNLDLRKLVEETRCWAFKSSNISAATANSVIIFAMKILQEILINECKAKDASVDNIFLIATAIAELGEVIKIYNPAPFNS